VTLLTPVHLSLIGYVVFLTLHFIDILITDELLRLGGVEYNPLARFLYSRFGVKDLFGLKIAAAVLITILFIQGAISIFLI
jgi:hypothetical protein